MCFTEETNPSGASLLLSLCLHITLCFNFSQSLYTLSCVSGVGKSDRPCGIFLRSEEEVFSKGMWYLLGKENSLKDTSPMHNTFYAPLSSALCINSDS